MSMNEHISKQFDADLETIRSNLLRLGGVVEDQIQTAIEGLNTGEKALLDRVFKAEQEVNRLEMEIDEQCNHVLALRQPTAYDLRLVITCLKMNRDLERIGDEAEKIARMAKMIHEGVGGVMPRVDVAHMASIAIEMLRNSLDAFARVDAVLAARVVREDMSVDDDFRSIIRQLITFMMEDARTISRSIEILFVAKALERIGDHSKNMAEQVVYLVKGRDVRHQGVESVEREARTLD